MKRYILILISPLFLLLAGCSKDDDGSNDNGNSEYYFQFKVDGTDQNYKFGDNQVNLVGSYGYDGNTGVYALNISGINNIFESGKNTLVIFVSDTGEISKGVNYSNIPGEGDDYPDFSFSMGYYNSEGNLFIAGGAGDNPMFGLYKPAFVKFSEIAESVISGTFSGTLLWYDNSGGTNVLMDSVVISEGKFNVPAY
ncbi:MAG: hypothetical protein WC384_07610 [Prolixibacteraceae bacterium]|jgi:hypothetical protein